MVSGLMIADDQGGRCYKMVDCMIGKQRHVRHSSYAAEILACADADDRGFYIKQCLASNSQGGRFRHILMEDSRGLFDTITTLNDEREYRLRQIVQRLRDSFE